MSGINKAIVVGRLGSAPTVKESKNDTIIAKFSVATSEEWKDKQTGEKRQTTEWHRIVAYGRLAEICGEYLKRGDQVYIEGKMQTRTWVGQDGSEKTGTSIMASVVQFLTSPVERNAIPSGRPVNTQEEDVRKPQGTSGAYDDLPF